MAGLDTAVQMAAVWLILSASVAFVALSGEAEYAYASVFASVATGGFAPPDGRRLRGLTRMCHGSGFKRVFSGRRWQGRQSEAEGEGIARAVETYRELASVTGDTGGD